MGEAGGFLGEEELEGAEVAVWDAAEQNVAVDAELPVDGVVVKLGILCNLDDADEAKRETLGFRPSDDATPEPGVKGAARILAGSEGLVSEDIRQVAGERDGGLNGRSGSQDLFANY